MLPSSSSSCVRLLLRRTTVAGLEKRISLPYQLYRPSTMAFSPSSATRVGTLPLHRTMVSTVVRHHTHDENCRHTHDGTNYNNTTEQQQEPRLQLSFTCTVSDCGTRSTHQFARSSYERGVVLVQCPGCKNRHLIADHLHWFTDKDGNAPPRTVEDIVRRSGGRVRRGIAWTDGEGGETIEVTDDSEASASESVPADNQHV